MAAQGTAEQGLAQPVGPLIPTTQAAQPPLVPEFSGEPTPVFLPPDDELVFYYLTQSGDTLSAVARRFDVSVSADFPSNNTSRRCFFASRFTIKIPRQVETPARWGVSAAR